MSWGVSVIENMAIIAAIAVHTEPGIRNCYILRQGSSVGIRDLNRDIGKLTGTILQCQYRHILIYMPTAISPETRYVSKVRAALKL